MKYDWNSLWSAVGKLADAMSVMLDTVGPSDGPGDGGKARRMGEALTAMINLKRDAEFNLGHPLVYRLGSADPVKLKLAECFPAALDIANLKFKHDPGNVYFSFSGVDVQAFLLADGQIKQAGSLQGVSVQVQRDGTVQGSLINLLLEKSEIRHGDKFDAIILQAINEYGHAWWATLSNVVIQEYGSGISIDDIAIDENLTYDAYMWTGWMPGQGVSWGDTLGRRLTDLAAKVLFPNERRYAVDEGWELRWKAAVEKAKTEAKPESK